MPEIILSRNFTLSLEMVRPWLQLRHTKNENAPQLSQTHKKGHMSLKRKNTIVVNLSIYFWRKIN